MPVLLSCSALHKSYGTRVLFDDLSLSLSEGDRIGLIGPNGSGKTSLLEILAGNEPPDSGERAVRKHTRLAYVPQDSLFAAGDTIASVLTLALDGAHLEELEKSTRIEMMLRRAGFENPNAAAAALSGGWRKRLALAAALVTSPDVLLLDEPTNHLDLDGILWLERAISAAKSCLVVTHDRYFLENVATRMVEINRSYPRSAFQVNGNYSEFLERREEFFEAASKQQESLATKVRREVEWLRRGPKARTGKSKARIDAAGRLIDEYSASLARSRTATAKIDFTASDRQTKVLVELNAVGKSMGGRTLFRNLDLTLAPGVRIGLVGANGSGKTTLLKTLEGGLAPDQGTVRRADALRLISFAQDRTEHLDLEKSLRRTLCPEGDSVIYRGHPIHVAGWAKRFLFRSDQLEMPVSSLSGGERARVLIARLMLETADVLLLDEPANDLDIPTLEVLEQSLLEFPGAIVLVSHDRYLLDRVSTMVIALDGSGAVGTFADYSQWEAFGSEPAAEKAVAAVKERDTPPPQKKLSYIDQLEWDSMEEKILQAERELALWQNEVEEASSDANRLPEAFEQLQKAQACVDELYQRWADLDARIAK